MTNNRLYVDFHIIQTVPPSCVNRDDVGRPKTAVYGGTTRARVSSQAWKHAIREYFKEIFDEENIGIRTKYAIDIVAEKIQKIDATITEEEAIKKAIDALGKVGIKVKDKKTNATGALFFFSSAQATEIAKLAVAGEKDEKVLKNALKEAPSVDIALFGRMLADDIKLNVDAACQVAHSISTHSVQNEYDYFTALDDYENLDNAGAGHLGTMEFNSATLYRYATINVLDLEKNLKKDTAIAVRDFAEAFIRSMPTGKQNSYANRTLPAMVYVTIRKDQPINLCGAFEKAIYSTDGYESKSIEEFFEYAKKIYADYSGNPEKSFIVGYGNDDGNIDAEKVDLQKLLQNIQEYVEEYLANEVK